MKVGKKIAHASSRQLRAIRLTIIEPPTLFFFLAPLNPQFSSAWRERDFSPPLRWKDRGDDIFDIYIYIYIFLARNFAGTGLTQPWPPSDHGKSRFDEYDREALFGPHRRANRKEERRSSFHSFLPGRVLERRAATRRKKVISETRSARLSRRRGRDKSFLEKGRGSKRNGDTKVFLSSSMIHRWLVIKKKKENRKEKIRRDDLSLWKRFSCAGFKLWGWGLCLLHTREKFSKELV